MTAGRSGASLGAELRNSFVIALWFVFLTFPIMVVKVNTIEKTVQWRWWNMALIGAGAFFLSLTGKYLLRKKEESRGGGEDGSRLAPLRDLMASRSFLRPTAGVLLLLALVFPFLFSSYQTGIMTTALMYVVLGLGLNIVVGLAGLLDLGYVAFYAVGAYTYALLNLHYGLGFWAALPVGALLGALFGLLLGFPVLRLRGDYLAIVTLGFGEIIRLVLENWNDFSMGPSGIANIPRPSLPGADLSLQASNTYLYFLMLAFVVVTVFVVGRLKDSRIGRAWIALREDEIACQAMGIDRTRTKLTAFALGATWAGMMGVVFAAKNTFVNPSSFTFHESVMILAIVVLGGMGSIAGVVVGALALILLQYYLSAFSDLRMLLFGAIMVIMMVFRPQGMIRAARRTYYFRDGEDHPREGP